MGFCVEIRICVSDGSNVIIVEQGLSVNQALWEELQEFFKYNYCIYRWKCINGSNDVYVGHTNNYEKRKQEHIKSCINRAV